MTTATAEKREAFGDATIFADTTKMSEAEWREARRSGIGGSDAAPVLGLSKWTTPFQVYQDKRGEVSGVFESPAMTWGKILEPVIRQRYADETGKDVYILNAILQHSHNPYMLANLDGYIPNDRLFEAKTARDGRDWGEAGTDEIPLPYLIQVQHYMHVTGFDLTDVAVLISGSDFRIYHIEADRELQEMIVEREGEFWECVMTSCPPAPVSLADVQAQFKRSTEGTVKATAEVLDSLTALRSVQLKLKEMEEEEKRLKAEVFRALGEKDTLVAPDGSVLATWKTAKGRESFDSKALQLAHPDIYKQFIKQGEPSRRFLLK